MFMKKSNLMSSVSDSILTMSSAIIRLYYWSPALVRGELHFMGLIEQDPASYWRTSQVMDRRGSRKVVTLSGKVYELVGRPVFKGEMRPSVPVWVQAKFQQGVPINLVEVIEQWAMVKRLEEECTVVRMDYFQEERKLPETDSVKKVNGIPYDYSCIYCSIIPRPRSICRSELYRHYAIRHFAEQLSQVFGKAGRFCADCKKDVSTSNWVSHVGQVHCKVEMFLPPQARVPWFGIDLFVCYFVGEELIKYWGS